VLNAYEVVLRAVVVAFGAAILTVGLVDGDSLTVILGVLLTCWGTWLIVRFVKT